ncbi:MFS transporter [Calidifontimicrobium sp. SYSU G02091]|uniref:MFS transporter n=1 Tax=Calidifontimicrobium sp. SYSU G02091 TaxID=2926421 RepID=UPI001F53ACF1|nr:MFS transporter [Calidifontimicrobium sp. SYSU G02091]MCI1191384.1 MFS transporter [Calidifontimicrobium sp. SYSU G02091]
MVASTLSPPLASNPVPWRDDARTIALVGVAHGTSHFFHLMLPPLFPALIAEFGVSYSQLGLLVTLFFVISGVGQALAGFVVDRVGARPVLFAALGCFVLAALAAASAQGFGGLMLAAALAGLGNAPFHPVDFTILNKRVSMPRLGHAFSVHGITGSLGWAAAPVFLIGVSTLTGSWRWALVAAAGWALAVLLLLVWQRDALDDRLGQGGHAKRGADATAAEHVLAFLRLPSVWLCFSFFFWSTVALAAIQSFAGPALGRLYGLPLEVTAFVVTGYMLASAAGMLLGGFVAVRARRLESAIAAAMLASAMALLLAGSGWLPGAVAAALAALSGLGTGLAGPSRDMLIKRATPPGATGRVYGTVYSGLDAGFAVGAPVFGALLDRGLAGGVFAGAALALVLGVASAAVVGLHLRRRAVLGVA